MLASSERQIPSNPRRHVLTGTNLVYTKKYNLRIVHEVIRVHGPLSRADVARHTQLSVQTVSNLVKELLGLGLVQEGGRRSEGRGAPSTELTINPDGAYAVGLDLDRDHLTGVLVDLAGQVRQRMHLEVQTPSSTEVLDLMCGMVQSMAKAQGLRVGDLAGLGVGVPGPMHRDEQGTGFLVNPLHVATLARRLTALLADPLLARRMGQAGRERAERLFGVEAQLDRTLALYREIGVTSS